MADTDQPIIIKRIKKAAHGHHGGAWKVAYADFVTAMMAFFLLLWLLNTTTPEQKMGLAEFFTPTIGIKDSQGIGFKGGIKQSEAGRSKSDLSQVGLVVSSVKQGDAPDAPNSQVGKSDPNAEDSAVAKKQEEEIMEDAEQMRATSEEIKQALNEDENLKDYKNNVIMQETPEGLKIDVIDDPQKPMFMPGAALMTDQGKKVLDSMARMIQKSPNNITISGHTDAAGATPNPQYTLWELSADRANAARRFLATTVLESDRVAKVAALADKELLTPQEPTSPRNRRITIVLMRGSYYRDPKAAAATRSLLSVPDPSKIKKQEEKKDDVKEESKQPVATKEDSIFNPSNAPAVVPVPEKKDEGFRPSIYEQVPQQE